MIEKLKESRTVISSLICFTCWAGLMGAVFPGQQYEGLTGAKSTNSIFDVRTGNPKSAVIFLDLIHKTFQDASIRETAGKHDFIVVFIGPSVKLISTHREGFSAEENELLDRIAARVASMAKDGIKLEICLAAASLFGVDPASVLPQIKQVDNGWISLIGYQSRGYALVPAY